MASLNSRFPYLSQKNKNYFDFHCSMCKVVTLNGCFDKSTSRKPPRANKMIQEDLSISDIFHNKYTRLGVFLFMIKCGSIH